MERLYSILVTLAFLTCIMCKEAEVQPDNPQNLVLIQRAGGWRLISSTINPPVNIGGGMTLTDTYPTIDDCHKDDIFKFFGGGRFIIADAVRCVDPVKDFVSGNYTYNDLEKTITINGEMGYDLEVSDSSFKYNLKEIIDNVEFTLTLTYIGL